ncbi:MAG: TlpA family protein disulfide reductase [Acidimicrobiia bacterium]
MMGLRLSWGKARRVGVAIVAAVVVVLLVRASLARPGVPDFTPTGTPVALPEAGRFSAVTLQTFEGLVVGQRGIPVIVNVWASWCAPCRTEMPLLQRAAENYSGRATIIGVATKDSPDAARAFLRDVGVHYPNVFDLSGDIRVRLGVTAYPTTYVFSADGRLTALISGGVSEQRLAALIEDALR